MYWKYSHVLLSCFQQPWHPKQNKVDIFVKSTFQEITQCKKVLHNELTTKSILLKQGCIVIADVHHAFLINDHT